MNFFNFKLLKKLLSYTLTRGQVKWIPYIYKYLPKNWTDDKKHNLFHFAARHQSDFLFELALFNQADINQKNYLGESPLHIFIYSSFIPNSLKDEENNLCDFQYNSILLDNFIKNGINVNQWISHPDREGQWGKDVATNSIANHMGSPIELLVASLHKYVLSQQVIFDNLELYERYEKFFNTLANSGANINLIRESGTFFDLSQEVQIDAMQITNSLIVSIFFTKYIMVDKHLYQMKPFYQSPHIDFSLADDNSNTVLHYLFNRIAVRIHSLKHETIINILTSLIENPSFKEEHLMIKNNFKVTPLATFRNETSIYRDFFEKVLLTKKLETIIPEHKEKEEIIKKKIVKI